MNEPDDLYINHRKNHDSLKLQHSYNRLSQAKEARTLESMTSETLINDLSKKDVKTAIVSPYLVHNGYATKFDEKSADFSMHQLTHQRFPNDRNQDLKSPNIESSSDFYRDHKSFDSNNRDREHRIIPSADKFNRINQVERLNDNVSIYSQAMNKHNFPLVLEHHYTNSSPSSYHLANQLTFQPKNINSSRNNAWEMYSNYKKNRNLQYQDGASMFLGNMTNSYSQEKSTDLLEDYRLIEKCRNINHHPKNIRYNDDNVLIGNRNIKKIFNEKLRLYRPDFVYNMQDIHNMASEMKMSGDQHNSSFEYKQEINKSSSLHPTKRRYSQSFPLEKQSDVIYDHESPFRSKNDLNQNCAYTHDKQSKLSKIDEIFDIFVPAMRTTIVCPEFVINLINIHKNEKSMKGQDLKDSKSYIQYVDAHGLTKEYIQPEDDKLSLEELMNHFRGLHESFIKFAHCHQSFQNLNRDDQKALLDRNALLFIMVCVLLIFVFAIFTFRH